MTNKQEEIVVEILAWISVIVIITSITLIIIL
jgi:hypothetical protein